MSDSIFKAAIELEEERLREERVKAFNASPAGRLIAALAPKIGPTIEDRDAGDEHRDAPFFFRPAFVPAWWEWSRGGRFDERVRNARHPQEDKFTPRLRIVRCYSASEPRPPMFPADEDGA